MLDADDLADAIWSETVSSVSNISGAWRSNPDAAVPVPTHRPMEQLFYGFANSLVDSLSGTSITVSSNPGTALGDYTAAGDESVTFVDLATAKVDAVDTAVLSLGWSTEVGRTLLESLVEATADYLDSYLEFTSIETIDGSGGSVTVVLPSVATSLASDLKSGVLSTGYFHYGDDPTQGLAGPLEDLLDSWAEAVDVILGASSTSLVIPTVAPLGASSFDLTLELA